MKSLGYVIYSREFCQSYPLDISQKTQTTSHIFSLTVLRRNQVEYTSASASPQLTSAEILLSPSPSHLIIRRKKKKSPSVYWFFDFFCPFSVFCNLLREHEESTQLRNRGAEESRSHHPSLSKTSYVVSRETVKATV